MRELYDSEHSVNADLERRVRSRTAELEQAELAARVSEARFPQPHRALLRLVLGAGRRFPLRGAIERADRRQGSGTCAQIGKRRWDIASPSMTAADWSAHRAVVEAHQPFHDLELSRIAPDGGTTWVSVSGEPFFGPSGEFKGYRGVGRDITARKHAEEKEPQPRADAAPHRGVRPAGASRGRS
jgi:PAS domain-containing protein